MSDDPNTTHEDDTPPADEHPVEPEENVGAADEEGTEVGGG